MVATSWRHVDHILDTIWNRQVLRLPFPLIQPANLGEANNQEPTEVEIDAQDKADSLAASSQPVVTSSISQQRQYPSREKKTPTMATNVRGEECHDVTLLNKSVYCVMSKPVCCKLVLHVVLLMCSLVLPVCMLNLHDNSGCCI